MHNYELANLFLTFLSVFERRSLTRPNPSDIPFSPVNNSSNADEQFNLEEQFDANSRHTTHDSRRSKRDGSSGQLRMNDGYRTQHGLETRRDYDQMQKKDSYGKGEDSIRTVDFERLQKMATAETVHDDQSGNQSFQRLQNRLSSGSPRRRTICQGSISFVDHTGKSWKRRSATAFLELSMTCGLKSFRT